MKVDKLDGLLTLLAPFGIIEIATSGLVALDRGGKSIDETRRPALSRNR